ncbi:lytic transglycosylase domain-containing protein [Nocardia sp. GCM10030253]|uniref:aggregation-promoting factor C-terminal-like domain-containing protein n=1 Tax=Nocardia sp. GCM10030253 TaxID=3273404 RepID=UPI00362CFB73
MRKEQFVRHVTTAVAVTLCALAIGATPATATPPDFDVAGQQANSAMPSGSSETQVGSSITPVRAATRLMAMTIVPLRDFWAFDNVIMRESSWDFLAVNPTSGAYGLGQALPPEKMASHGADWPFNPVTQIRWTYDYMNKVYGSPAGAWAFWQQHHWY